jgi:hypothetical protein
MISLNLSVQCECHSITVVKVSDYNFLKLELWPCSVVSPIFSCILYIMPVLDGLRHGEPVDGSPSPANNVHREKIVVVGLGMVAISFM